MNSNESPQVAQAKLDVLNKQLALHRAQESRANLLLKLGFVLTFLLYLAFNLHLYLGDALSWKYYFGDWQAITGFVFMAVIVVLMALFLAWVKHHAYLHFGLYGSITLIVVTVIGFALFAEFFSSSANQDAKSNIQLAGNAAYQQSVNFNPAASISVSGTSAEVAAASKKLARCQANLGKPGYKHCNGDAAELKSLQASQTATMQAQAQMATAAMQANYDRQDKLKADSYNPAIVSVAKLCAWFAGGNYADHIKLATLLVMLFVAVCFEILHHFLSKAKERAQNTVMALELEIAKYTSNLATNNLSASAPPTPAPNDGQYQDNKAGFGFIPSRSTAPAMAQHQSVPEATGTAYSTVAPPLFKYQQHPQQTAPEAKKQPFGFVPPRSKIANPEQVQADVPKPAPGSTYRNELRNGSREFHNQPLDAPTPAKPDNQKPGGTGLQNPALGSAEEHYHLPISEPEKLGAPNTPNSDSQSREADTPNLAASIIPSADLLYEQWKSALMAREVVTYRQGGKPVQRTLLTVNASNDFIQKLIAGVQVGKTSPHPKRIKRLVQVFYAKAVKEGILTDNHTSKNRYRYA